jgi:uncharacterized protein with ParB-like and HNH nuclease domain
MDARAKSVRDILYSADQYLVPFFQRHYSWTRGHWERLFSNIEALLEEEDEVQHFLGPLVCTPFKPVPGEVTPYQLIDGQQRLTTLTILLAALRDEARAYGLGSLAEEIQEDYLIHKRRAGLQRFKVIPRLGDREVYIEIMEGRPNTGHSRNEIIQAWHFFRNQISELLKSQAEETLKRIFQAVTARLSVVMITIDGENPYEIFESLNAAGLPLEESDLIRNYVFMQVPMEEQDTFNRDQWMPFENLFNPTKDFPGILATLFYRSYLMRMGNYSKNKGTFVDFKRQAKDRGLSPKVQVEELSLFARYELSLRRPKTCDHEHLRKAFQRIQTLEVTTSHPLLLNLLDRHAQGQLLESDLLGCIQDLESFIIRRTACGESTRGYGRWFTGAIRAIEENPRDDLRNYWLQHGWPDDRAFVSALQAFVLYTREPKKCRLILEALEETEKHREPVDLSKTSIEHVMPQTIGDDESGRQWKIMLGISWKETHEQFLHTLGNLTLSAYNPELSNRPYLDKKRDYAESHLRLNKYFGTVEIWEEEAIRKRGLTLSETAAKLWPRPGGFPYVPGPVEQDLDDTTPLKGHGKLSIKIDWSTKEQQLPAEEIIGDSDAEKMVSFIKRLAEVFGAEIFSKLERLRISRGPIISSDPSSDFVNQRRGTLFGHHPIPGTGYYVLTHSDRKQKVRDLQRMVNYLGLAQNSYIIQQLDDPALPKTRPSSHPASPMTQEDIIKALGKMTPQQLERMLKKLEK